MVTGIAGILPAEWDALANPPEEESNPFLTHAFLNALEASGSVAPQTGWHPAHLVLQDEQGKAKGLMPLYVKSHSRGEYVFDQGWADAFHRAGGQYYPKLQCAVPFTPATGRRLLVPEGPDKKYFQRLLASGAKNLCQSQSASSVHITFAQKAEWDLLGDDGWLQRTDTQFHWRNDSFANFDDFLAALSSRKRKNIRKERQSLQGRGLTIERLTGPDICEHHWDEFFRFYTDTGNRKWGTPYLTRAFFSLITQAMAEYILLVMVKREGRYIAGALNFIGSRTLFGRNWGAIEHHPNLHFEACYYQAMDFAIERGLARIEAGAQGPHKLARGYLPETTYSMHYVSDPGLAAAVDNYLQNERQYVKEDVRLLARHSPFKKTTGRS